MGYTRYWNRTDKEITSDFCEEVNKILIDCAKKGIAIRGGFGDGSPIVSTKEIRFNGNGSVYDGENCCRDLSHETFYLGSDDEGFNFCKTARKPYDYAVRKVLNVAKRYGIVTDVRSDGANNKIYSDEEYINGLVNWNYEI